MTTNGLLEQLTNYRPISPLILTGGQPTTEQIALIAQAGCESELGWTQKARVFICY